MLKKTGVATPEELANVLPSEGRLNRGAVAVLECFQNIPCNPCATSCPRHAIQEFVDINDIPSFDGDLCNGCAICVANCPGLAIFVIDETYSPDETLVKLPYEFTPLPASGDVVVAVSRAGDEIGHARVVRVQNPPVFDRTAVVHVAVPKALGHEIRFIKAGGPSRA
ncbi:MAG: 4Fe-4S ferredoxin [Bacillota bacterium]|nr:MAG: 4Fe-4S ferredoxin [Bacillota bacterium]MBS3950521.1 4Fe-4S ferredoxin [Peptococcaceae bacterium]